MASNPNSLLIQGTQSERLKELLAESYQPVQVTMYAEQPGSESDDFAYILGTESGKLILPNNFSGRIDKRAVCAVRPTTNPTADWVGNTVQSETAMDSIVSVDSGGNVVVTQTDSHLYSNLVAGSNGEVVVSLINSLAPDEDILWYIYLTIWPNPGYIYSGGSYSVPSIT